MRAKLHYNGADVIDATAPMVEEIIGEAERTKADAIEWPDGTVEVFVDGDGNDDTNSSARRMADGIAGRRRAGAHEMDPGERAKSEQEA